MCLLILLQATGHLADYFQAQDRTTESWFQWVQSSYFLFLGLDSTEEPTWVNDLAGRWSRFPTLELSSGYFTDARLDSLFQGYLTQLNVSEIWVELNSTEQNLFWLDTAIRNGTLPILAWVFERESLTVLQNSNLKTSIYALKLAQPDLLKPVLHLPFPPDQISLIDTHPLFEISVINNSTITQPDWKRFVSDRWACLTYLLQDELYIAPALSNSPMLQIQVDQQHFVLAQIQPSFPEWQKWLKAYLSHLKADDDICLGIIPVLDDYIDNIDSFYEFVDNWLSENNFNQDNLAEIMILEPDVLCDPHIFNRVDLFIPDLSENGYLFPLLRACDAEVPVLLSLTKIDGLMQIEGAFLQCPSPKILASFIQACPDLQFFKPSTLFSLYWNTQIFLKALTH